MSYRIDWLNIGADYNGTETQKAKLLSAVADIDTGSTRGGEWDCWLTIPTDGKPLSLAMMPGEGIKATVKQLRLPNVSHVAISARCAPMGLYGIRAHYKNGEQVEVFVIDSGDGITPVFCRVAVEAQARMEQSTPK